MPGQRTRQELETEGRGTRGDSISNGAHILLGIQQQTLWSRIWDSSQALRRFGPTLLCSLTPSHSPDPEFPWGWGFICLVSCSDPRAWSTAVLNGSMTTPSHPNSSTLDPWPFLQTPSTPSPKSACVPFHSLGPDAFLILLTLTHL